MPSSDNQDMLEETLRDDTIAIRKHPLAKCEECPWYEKSAYAGAAGPEDADIVVVGEAPGRVEADTGIPFTGPSGQLLDKVLAHHGFDRDQIRFTNVAACHPPYVPGSSSVVPPKDVVAACAPRLREEVGGRSRVLLLGNTAKEAVLETREAITAVRQGPPRGSSRFPGARIVATVHPAACLRTSDMFPHLVRDVKKLRDADVYVKWEPPKFASFEDPGDARSVIAELHERRGHLAVDIEVGVEKDQSFTHPSSLLSVGISYEPNKAVVLGEQALKNQGVLRDLGKLLSQKEVLCHNGKFDLQVLMRLGIISDPGLAYDTMLASYVLDERPGQHGLKGLASERLGAPDYASDVKKYIGSGDSYALIPRPALYQYNAYDAALTYNLWDLLSQELAESNLRHVHDRLVRYSNEMVYIELDGVKVDQPYLDHLTEHYLDLLAPLEVEIQEAARIPMFNPRSPQQVKGYLHGQGVRVMDTTEETLRELLARTGPTTELHQFLQLLLRHRREAKLYGTYVKGIRKRLHGGRVYSTFLLHGSTSGRLASRNPNLQNIPRESSIRRMFVPGEGNTFVQCDYGQAELRVAACESKDPWLRDVFSDPNRDIFNELSDKLYGPGNWQKSDRIRVKAYAYGSLYGREAFSIAQEFKISPGEAEKGQREFFGVMPNLKQWQQKDVIDAIFKGGRGLQTSFGRKRRFWLITRENKMDVTKEGLSFIPQSTANDICLSAMVRLRRSFGSGASAPRIRIPVHDSLLVECRERDREEVARLMRETMQQAAVEEYSDFVPFTTDAEFGKSWGDLTDV